MHFRFIILLFLFVSLSYAETQKTEILAKTLDKDGNIVHAKDDVVLYSDKYIITADEAYYDYNTSDLELIGDITVMQGAEFSTRSGYAKLNLQSDSGNLMPMFAYTGESKIWLKCDTAQFDERYYTTKKSIVSSCDVQYPDWKITFTTGDYDREEQFLSTYNTLFYINDVPMFYLPYFSFPTDKTRRSGFLRPEIGYGRNEGFYYLQPIYFAPQMNWDLQLNPQIRTNRGNGLHATLRFADSPYSTGEVTLGKFKEKSKYVEENGLTSNEHYGYSIEYDRSKLFSNYISGSQDGLWIDFNYLNDIDYYTTMNSDDITYATQVQSTMNYYFEEDLNYFGLYAKYYIETTQASNDSTVQELPTFHYHRTTNSILTDNVFYSIDYKSTNYTSEEALEANTHQIIAPISIHFPLLNDFIHFKASENFYIANVNYELSGVKNEESTVENYHTFSLYTELAKRYEDFFHTLYFGLEYTLPGNSKKSDGFEDLLDDDDLESLVLDTRENLAIDLAEYFYNSEGRKIISHSLSQSIILNDLATNEYKYTDLTNDLRFFISDNITIKNILNYSHEFSRISKFQTSLAWKIDDYSLSFIHTYKKDSDDDITNYLTFSAATNYVKNYNFFTSTNYDIEEDYFKSWQVGYTMKKKCWDYQLVYKEDITPDSSNTGSTNIRGIYLMFNLYPLGGVSYDFTKETTSGD